MSKKLIKNIKNSIFLKSLILILLMLVFLTNNVFSGNVTYTDSTYEFYADMWYTQGYSSLWDSHIFLNNFVVKGQLSTGLSNTINYPNSSSIEYTQVLLYPQSSEDFTLKHQAIDLNTSNSGTFSISQNKYKTPDETIVHLDTTSCNIEDLSFNTETNTLTVTSNLNPFQVYDWNTATGQFELKTADFSNSDTEYFDNLLNKYYHMKSNVVGKIYFNDSLIETIYEDDMNATSALANLNGDNYINFSYIEPESNTQLTFSNKANYLYLLQTYNNYGTYTFEFDVTPIDLKCDLDDTNALESDEFTSRAENFTLQIRLPNTPTISSPSDSSTFQGGEVDVVSTISDPDGNDLRAYFLVDNSVVQTQTDIESGSTITGELTGLTDGFHNLSLIISDLYTNISSSNISILMETPPVGANVNVSSGSSSIYNKTKIYTFYSTWTDFNGIDEVIFNFNGNNYSSISNAGTNYSINFTDLTVGNYSYQWFANDTQGSDNETRVFNFEITKATPQLNLTLNNISNNITIQINENITINASEFISDIGNITLFENGNLINSGVDNLINTTSYSIFNETNNITLSYSSTQNFTSNSVSYFIRTIDTINPQVTNLIPNGTIYTIGSSIEISANVTDNYLLNSVIAQINLPNGTSTNLTLTNQTINNISSNKYNNTYTIPNLIGTYNITIIATDHINNINNTEITNFSTQDIIAPIVNIVNPTINTFYNTSDLIEISVNVTDETTVNSVIAQITFPNSTTYNYTLNNNFGNNYNSSFSIATNIIGIYNVSFIVTDSSNNVNNNESTNFTSLDNILPKITLNNPNNTTDYNIGDTIIINSTTTDNILVNSVYANIIYPNSTSINLSLFNSTNNNNKDIFNNTFNLSQTGIYNITIFANDSSNNINVTEILSFNVSDFTNPSVTVVSPTENRNFNITNIIEISVNVSDLSNISSVIAQINYPNTTSVNVTLNNAIGDKYNNSFIIPNNIIGIYNITIIASDIFSNTNNTETSNFTVTDNINPNVSTLLPTINSNFNTNDLIEISANVTDEIFVSNVIAQIDYPNATSVNLSLTNARGDKYNHSFTIPTNIIGLFNVTIIANDSSNNINNSQTSNFTTFDNINPNLTIISPINNSVYNYSNVLILNATINDNILINDVYVNVTLPNSTINIIQLIKFNNSDQYNNTFTPNAIGNYSIIFFVSDSSSRINISKLISFRYVDVTNPNVVNTIPTDNEDFNLSDRIEISANVTDDISVSNVIAQINYPNATSVNVTLENAIGDKYNGSFTIANNLIGIYNITYTANDSSNNINNSVITSFNVLDNINPNVNTLLPTINSNFNTNDLIEISANVTDEISVSNVIAQIDYPNATSVNVTLENTIGDKYNNSFTIPTNIIGLFNITIFANDSSNNINSSVTSNFTTFDNINPDVNLKTPQANSNINISSNLTISINATDNILIDEVYATVSYPNSSMYNYTLTSNNNIEYNYTFTVPNLLGLYNLTFFVNDSSSNENNTVTSNFTTFDNINPSVSTVSPTVNSNFNITDMIEISANVTDEISVSNVIAKVDYPNATSVNVTLENAIGDKYNGSFTISNNLIGRFNITIIANDSSNNINGSQTSYFNSVDPFNPNVTLVSSENATNISIDNSVLLSINVSDDILVSSVKTQIDIPNSSSYNITLTNVNNSNSYNNTYTIPKLLGRYNLTYIAIDSSGNINNSIITYFNAIDNTSPNVSVTSPIMNSTFNVSDSIEVSSNITDNLLVDTFLVNISYPNGTNNVLSLINQTSNKFNTSFAIPNIIGRYNITFIANDSSDNINNTQTTYFNAIDLVSPVSVSFYPKSNTSIRANGNFNITLNISDNVEISTVFATINYPNATSVNLTLNNNLGDNYTNLISINNLTGRYNITFTSNDTSNNILTNTSYFIVTLPNINSSSISKTTVANSSTNSFFISAINYDELYANITLPDLNTTILNLTNGFDTTFSNVSQIGIYNVTLIARDTNNNIDSVNYTFEVFDSVSFTSNTTGFNGTILNGTFQIILNNTILQNGSLSSGNVSQTTVNTPVALLYKLFDNKISIKFNNFNLSENSGEYFYVDNYENTNGYLTILGVNTTYNFTNATVTITYNDSSVGTENNLKLFYCSNYNFNGRTCSSSFVDITSNGTLDTASNTYTFTANGFSAYAIDEVTPQSSSSSGGGPSSRASLTPPTTQELTIANNETCSYDWVCTEWEPNVCPLSGVQTRTCSNIGTCSGNEGKPTETRTCSNTIGIEINMINELFHKIGMDIDDISVSLNVSYIVNQNNLSINDSIIGIYQLIDSNEEIVLELNRNEKINENESIIFDLNTREILEGEYEFVITLIINENRYVDSKKVIIANKELYVDPINNETTNPLTGNFLADKKGSIIGVIVGVLIISFIIVSVNAYNHKGKNKPRNKNSKIKKI